MYLKDSEFLLDEMVNGLAGLLGQGDDDGSSGPTQNEIIMQIAKEKPKRAAKLMKQLEKQETKQVKKRQKTKRRIEKRRLKQEGKLERAKVKQPEKTKRTGIKEQSQIVEAGAMSPGGRDTATQLLPGFRELTRAISQQPQAPQVIPAGGGGAPVSVSVPAPVSSDENGDGLEQYYLPLGIAAGFGILALAMMKRKR